MIWHHVFNTNYPDVFTIGGLFPSGTNIKKKAERGVVSSKKHFFRPRHLGDIFWMLSTVFCVHNTLCKQDEPLWVFKACVWVFVCFDCLKNCLHYWIYWHLICLPFVCFDGYKTPKNMFSQILWSLD